MPLDVVRLRDSDLATVSSGDEFKAAVLLWSAAWHQVPAGSVPKDERWLARHSGAGPLWKKVREEALRGFVECADGRLYHRVVCEKVNEAWASKLERREKDEHDKERKRKEREERSRMFEQLQAAGVHPEWNTNTKELRKLVTDLSRGQTPSVTDQSQGQVRDQSQTGHGDLSRLRQGQGYGQGYGDGQGYGQGSLNSTPNPIAPASRSAKPTRPKAKGEPKPKPNTATTETWGRYAAAFRTRYGVDPVRNATVNGQLSNLVARLGKEAPAVAEFFVGSNTAWHVRQGHSIGCLLNQAEKIRTEWATGRAITDEQARQGDRKQTNLNAFAPLIAEAEAREIRENDDGKPVRDAA